MADEKNSERGSGEGGSGKRRYYRRRKNASQSATSRESSEGQSKTRRRRRADDGKAEGERGSSTRSRSGTRRRTRRSRTNRRSDSNDGQNRNETSAESAASGSTASNRRAERSRRSSRAERDDSNRRSRSRRRRRSSANQAPAETVRVVAESTVDAIAHEYQQPSAVYVYTHVSRPSYQGMGDYRGEHFPRVGRKLEDFHIDISSLLDNAGNLRLFGAFQREENSDAGNVRMAEVYAEGDWEEDDA